jgi:hypothetical protein
MCIPCIIINDTCGFAIIGGKSFQIANETFTESIRNAWPRMSPADRQLVRQHGQWLAETSATIAGWSNETITFVNLIAGRSHQFGLSMADATFDEVAEKSADVLLAAWPTMSDGDVALVQSFCANVKSRGLQLSTWSVETLNLANDIASRTPDPPRG